MRLQRGTAQEHTLWANPYHLPCRAPHLIPADELPYIDMPDPLNERHDDRPGERVVDCMGDRYGSGQVLEPEASETPAAECPGECTRECTREAGSVGTSLRTSIDEPAYEHGPLVIYQNEQSGRHDLAGIRHVIDEVLQQARIPFVYVGRKHGMSLERSLSLALDQAGNCAGTMVVSGGDGTINAAASLAVARQQPLAIIPAGTFNFVARTHGIPEDTAEAVELILRARPLPTRVGMINDRLFMVNASIGSFARLQREREGFKHTLGRSRGIASLAAVLSALHHSIDMQLRITRQGRHFDIDCSTLIACNNRLQLELVGVDALPRFDQDELVCAVLAPVSVPTQLAMIWRGWLGRVNETPELNTFIFQDIEIDRRHRRKGAMDVSVDGEAYRMQMPLRIRVSDKPLWLVRPDKMPQPE